VERRYARKNRRKKRKNRGGEQVYAFCRTLRSPTVSARIPVYGRRKEESGEGDGEAGSRRQRKQRQKKKKKKKKTKTKTKTKRRRRRRRRMARSARGASMHRAERRRGGRAAMEGSGKRWMNEKKKSHPPWRPKAMGERRPVAKGHRIGRGDSATFEVLLRSPGSPTWPRPVAPDVVVVVVVVVVERSPRVNRTSARPDDRVTVTWRGGKELRHLGSSVSR